MNMIRQNRRGSFFEKNIDARVLLALYPLMLLAGKAVRWTIMRGTLVNYSKGWGWIDPIMDGGWSWQFFGMDEIADGDIGQGDNVYTFFKFFWTFLWGKVPDSFASFEVCITITFGFFFFLVLAGMKKRLSLMEAVFVCLSTVVLSVYCFCLSKEPFQMIYFFLLYLVLRSRSLPDNVKLYAGYAVILLSVCTFRTYYALILVFAVAFQLLLRHMCKPGKILHHYDSSGKLTWKMLAATFLVLVALYFVMMFFLSIVSNDLYLRFQDALLYASEATSGSNTYIENVLAVNESNPTVFSLTLEYAIAVLRLLCPLELISHGPKYWPYVLYQFFMTIFLLKSVRSARQNNAAQNAATIIFVGYVFASASFEVDYGAWVRHCAVTIPCVFIMSGIVSSTKTMEYNG